MICMNMKTIQPSEKKLLIVKRTHVYVIVFVLCCCMTIAVLALVQSFGGKKIAFVRSGEIINKYAGMKDAQQVFQEKIKVWQANIDTLESEFHYAANMFAVSRSSLALTEQQHRQEQLRGQEENLAQYRHAIEIKSQEEEKMITQGVLNQINSFITDYGKEHGYDVILGTTMSGSVLYGNDALDITDNVLQKLNSAYIKK
jgi:outer membrane protein